jgi:hypothetical protein
MASVLRQVHAWVAWLFVASIVVQVFLAGAAIANLGGSGNFDAHAGFGYEVVGILALALLVTAIVARAGRRNIGIAVGLFVLYIVQTILPNLRDSMPSLAALHPLNAMVLFVLGIWYARVAWRNRNAAVPAPAGL